MGGDGAVQEGDGGAEAWAAAQVLVEEEPEGERRHGAGGGQAAQARVGFAGEAGEEGGAEAGAGGLLQGVHGVGAEGDAFRRDEVGQMAMDGGVADAVAIGEEGLVLEGARVMGGGVEGEGEAAEAAGDEAGGVGAGKAEGEVGLSP